MKVIIYTCVYNSEKTLPNTIESVLRQSYGSFEYHIEDNGSTDETLSIIHNYADRDHRIIPHIREKNHFLTGEPPPVFTFSPPGGEYFTSIDGDDWWEPDYLEQLLAFAERYHLDIACTGTLAHVMRTGNTLTRQLPQPLVLEKRQFADGFSYYHAFFRTIWGKLIRTNLISQVHWPNTNAIYHYGADTVYSFQVLRNAGRIGVDSSILHHYRIAQDSVSTLYDVRRFESDVYLYNDAVDFLSAFGPISAQNRRFLQRVYANALSDTTKVIQNSTLSPAEKLREYRTIAEHPLTAATYQGCKEEEDANRSKLNLLLRALKAGANSGKQDNIDFCTTMQALLPQCGQAVSTANVQMFLTDSKLLQALLRDDPEAVLQHLLGRMEKNQGVKKYSIPETIQNLAMNKPLLCQIGDAVFLRKYHGIYQKVWQGEHIDALDEMTGLLLENKVTGGQETFLQLYLSLAATEDQVPAFIFGKLQLAKLYLRQNRKEDCCVVVNELIEMGVDNEELTAICAELDP